MGQSDPATGVLSHVEAVYRPGERQLAIDLFTALGCTIYDTDTMSPSGSTYISVHPDPNERGLDNVIYLSEMSAVQNRMEEILRQRLETDDELRASRDSFRAMFNEKPFGLSHIAIRYPSFEVLEQQLKGVEERLTPALKARATIKVLRPGDSDDVDWVGVQAFVFTDIAVSGVSVFGQVFELSAYG